MDKCCLCLTNKADFAGSHIIPFFLIKSLVNEEGYKKRGDKEVSFRISTNNTNIYIGRSVSPKGILEVYGRPMTDEEIENNLNHYTEDFFLCTRCEKRFSKIEDYYSFNSKKSQEAGKWQNNNVGAPLGILFWISILWRISVTNFNGLKLNKKAEKNLRNILNTCLGDSIEETKEKTINNLSLLNNLSTIILVQVEPKDPTSEACLVHPRLRFPYTLVINNYVIFIYLKDTHLNSIRQTTWGYENLINKELLNKATDKKEKFSLIPLDVSNQAKESIALYIANNKIKYIDSRVIKFIRKARLPLNINEFHRVRLAARQNLLEREDENFKVINGIPNDILFEVIYEALFKNNN